MKELAVFVAVFTGLLTGGVALGQDSSCTNARQTYPHGALACVSGFEQECANGSWVNQNRFCSQDPQFDGIAVPNVVAPALREPGAPAEPAARVDGTGVVTEEELAPAAPGEPATD